MVAACCNSSAHEQHPEIYKDVFHSNTEFSETLLCSSLDGELLQGFLLTIMAPLNDVYPGQQKCHLHMGVVE